MAYLEALHLDEIPYGRLTARDLAYGRQIGWGGGRVKRPKSRPLDGFWLQIARAVRGGAATDAQIAGVLDCPFTAVSRATCGMVRRGHLLFDGEQLSLAKRTRRQLIAEGGR